MGKEREEEGNKKKRGREWKKERLNINSRECIVCFVHTLFNS